MPEVLILRLEAQLMSFGAVVVDNRHPTNRFPQRSWLAGLMGNALGFDRREHEALAALQNAFQYAARADVPGVLLRDYQTVDLGAPKSRRMGLLRDGTFEKRDGANSEGTHEMEYWYLADAAVTVALSFKNTAEAHAVAAALERPARPLFLGRKTCTPAASIFQGFDATPDVYTALASRPMSAEDAECTQTTGATARIAACWPVGQGPQGVGARVTLGERKDFRNNLHTGHSMRIEGYLTVPVATNPEEQEKAA